MTLPTPPKMARAVVMVPAEASTVKQNPAFTMGCAFWWRCATLKLSTAVYDVVDDGAALPQPAGMLSDSTRVSMLSVAHVDRRSRMDTPVVTLPPELMDTVAPTVARLTATSDGKAVWWAASMRLPVQDATPRTCVLATRHRWRPNAANVDVAVVALLSAVGLFVCVGESGSAWLHSWMSWSMVTAAPAVMPVVASTVVVWNSATWDTST
mmetsp:Transcript_64664/g.131490  ORF Transcript_64664/g.131490 Transcript_64664/m.131490 type:complete len:210 (-) Transcript_64664:827-1456(-)